MFVQKTVLILFNKSSAKCWRDIDKNNREYANQSNKIYPYTSPAYIYRTRTLAHE